MSKKIEVLEKLKDLDEKLHKVEVELSDHQKDLERGKQSRYEYIDRFLNIPIWEKEALKRSFSLLLDNYKEIIITQKKILDEYRESEIWLMQKLRDEINFKPKALNISKFSNN